MHSRSSLWKLWRGLRPSLWAAPATSKHPHEVERIDWKILRNWIAMKPLPIPREERFDESPKPRVHFKTKLRSPEILLPLGIC